MNFKNWESTIQKMTEEFNLESKESGKNRILTEWRRSLAKEPHLLQPFQIDEIVREVRKRLTPFRKKPLEGNSQARSTATTSAASL